MFIGERSKGEGKCAEECLFCSVCRCWSSFIICFGFIL